MKHSVGNRRGFTIIEVVLVLAIAGLIFLMVFVALPSLQRNQRNAQRKDDLVRFASAITSYSSNNSGKIPFRANGRSKNIDKNFVRRYIDQTCKESKVETRENTVVATTDCDGESFRDPDGTNYRFIYYGDMVTEFPGYDVAQHEDQKTNNHIITVVTYARCDDVEGFCRTDTGPNSYVMFMAAEGGALICVDNS